MSLFFIVGQSLRKILEKVLEQQQMLLTKVNENTEMLQTITMNLRAQDPSLRPENWPKKLPLTRMVEFLQWEDALQDPQFLHFAVSIVVSSSS